MTEPHPQPSLLMKLIGDRRHWPMVWKAVGRVLFISLVAVLIPVEVYQTVHHPSPSHHL